MRWRAFSIAIVLAVIPSLSAFRVPTPERASVEVHTPRTSPATQTPAPGLTSVEIHTPLKSVSKRENFVFALTPDGLFRASLETKRWERLKTPPTMPLNGHFAWQPGREPQAFYVALRSRFGPEPRPGLRHGLYLTEDDGETWKLVSERDDFGFTLLHPSGVLFAVTGDDGANAGNRLLRSTDLGKTWSDITGRAWGQFMALDPDPDHPGLVRIHALAMRQYMHVAEDENYQWKTIRVSMAVTGRRPSDEFFARHSSGPHLSATMANYFGYDFGNRTCVDSFEVVPLETRFEFARGARVVVPVRVVYHHDPETLWPERRKSVLEGRPLEKSDGPTEKLADQPGGTDFWGLRVETADNQVEKYPPDRRIVTISGRSTPDGKTVSSRTQPPAVKYRVFHLSPSTPYEREIDLVSSDVITARNSVGR